MKYYSYGHKRTTVAIGLAGLALSVYIFEHGSSSNVCVKLSK